MWREVCPRHSDGGLFGVVGIDPCRMCHSGVSEPACCANAGCGYHPTREGENSTGESRCPSNHPFEGEGAHSQALGLGSVLALYEARLKTEVAVINTDILMGALDKIRTALGGKKATVTYGPQGEMYVNVDEQGIEVHPSDSVADIRAKLENPFESQTSERSSMSITGLQSGAFQSALAEMKRKLAEKQMEGVAKIAGSAQAAEAKIEEATAGASAKIDKEVEDALQEFAEFTNGGPA